MISNFRYEQLVWNWNRNTFDQTLEIYEIVKEYDTGDLVEYATLTRLGSKFEIFLGNYHEGFGME